MKEIDISVIVPVYNVEKYVDKCIKSIMGQTKKNIEILLIDDGSTDRSFEICNELSKIDDRIIVIHNENNGVSYTRNYGIDMAKGEYVAFVDGDDWLENSALEKLYTIIKDQGADILYEVNRFDGDEINSYYDGSKKEVQPAEALEELVKGNFITSVDTAIYKKELLQSVRFNRDIVYWEDLDFQLQSITIANKIILDYVPYYHVTKREHSATSSVVTKKNCTCLKIYDYLGRYGIALSCEWIGNTILYKMLLDLIISISRKGISKDEKKYIYTLIRKKAQICKKKFKQSRYTTLRGKVTICIAAISPTLAINVLRAIYK